MKLSKDNFELIMFDLLEGNLSEKDALSVMKQIEEDEYYFKQWKLFKSTVLIADSSVVYSGKDKLLKEVKGVIPMYKWASIAVAACLLIALVIFWPAPQQDTLTTSPQNPTEIIEQPENDTQTIAIDEQNNNVISEEESDDLKLEDELFDSPRVVKSEPDKSERNEHKNEEYVKPVIDPLPGNEDTLVLIEESIAEIPHSQESLDLIEDQIDTVKEVEPVRIANNTVEPDKKNLKNDDEGVTSNRALRIRDRAVQFIAAVSNPKVKIRPTFKGRKSTLEIELETKGYQAVASLQPFKKKSN